MPLHAASAASWLLGQGGLAHACDCGGPCRVCGWGAHPAGAWHRHRRVAAAAAAASAATVTIHLPRRTCRLKVWLPQEGSLKGTKGSKALSRWYASAGVRCRYST
jgi:hypothetical protein